MIKIKAGTLEEIFETISEYDTVKKMEALSETGIQAFERTIEETFKKRMGIVLMLIDVPENKGKINLLTTTNLPKSLLRRTLQEALTTPAEGEESSSVN
jgi:hypothetical protein